MATTNNKKTRTNHKHNVTTSSSTTQKQTQKNKTTKTSSTKKETNNKRKLSKQEKNILIGIFIGYLIVCAIVFMFFGPILGLIFAFGVGTILLISRLLDETRSSTKKRKIIKGVLITILILTIIVIMIGSAFIFYVINKAPDFNPEKLIKKESSILYNINGEEFARLGSKLRENVSYDDLPEVFIDALIATEDSRFFQHNGFDAPRFIVASAKQLIRRGSGGGASTLSMQVIKNSLTSTEDEGWEGIVRKFTDIYLAVFKLEKGYTKEQIIEFYVNNHFLGSNSYGVEQASQIYSAPD